MSPFRPNGIVLFVYLGTITGDRIEFGRRPDDLAVGLLVKGTAKKINLRLAPVQARLRFGV